MGKNLIQHSSATPEWYTPAHVMDFVRDVLGGPIDFDPCSCPLANRNVQARQYLTKDDDGLTSPWQGGRIYINPPGGKRGAGPKAFARKAVESYESEQATHVAFMCFALNQLATLAPIFKGTDHHVFVFAKRLKFIGENGTEGTSPAQPSALIFLGDIATGTPQPEGLWLRAI